MFSNIKEGIYLMDDGLTLYLFIGRQCDEELMVSVVGKAKIQRNEHMTEQDLREQGGRNWGKL